MLKNKEWNKILKGPDRPELSRYIDSCQVRIDQISNAVSTQDIYYSNRS